MCGLKSLTFIVGRHNKSVRPIICHGDCFLQSKSFWFAFGALMRELLFDYHSSSPLFQKGKMGIWKAVPFFSNAGRV